jgi:hypothetical protein
MIIPMKRRFTFTFDRQEGGFCLRIVLGFVIFLISRRYSIIPQVFQKETQIAIGWVPASQKWGESIPCWKPYWKIYRDMQDSVKQ